MSAAVSLTPIKGHDLACHKIVCFIAHALDEAWSHWSVSLATNRVTRSSEIVSARTGQPTSVSNRHLLLELLVVEDSLVFRIDPWSYVLNHTGQYSIALYPTAPYACTCIDLFRSGFSTNESNFRSTD